MMMTEKEKMLAGELYISSGEELKNERRKARLIAHAFNQTTEEEGEKRVELITSLFGKVGKNVSVKPNLRCDYGYNISVGDNFYANYDAILLDIAPITIGDNVMLAPRVGLFTATHPIDADVRIGGLEYGKPITIGDNVWIGAGAIVNPGVTIGENSVIGSGSVVTKDIPSNVVAAGNPCRVIREITESEQANWKEKERLYHENK